MGVRVRDQLCLHCLEQSSPFILFKKAKQNPFSSSVCCRLKLSFNDPFPSVTPPWKWEPTSGAGAVWSCLCFPLHIATVVLQVRRKSWVSFVAGECVCRLGNAGDEVWYRSANLAMDLQIPDPVLVFFCRLESTNCGQWLCAIWSLHHAASGVSCMEIIIKQVGSKCTREAKAPGKKTV